MPMSANDSTAGGTLVAEEQLAKVKPGKNESKKDFVARCISAMSDEGVEDNEQRVAMCNSMWEQAMKKRDTVLKAAELVIDSYGVDGEPDEELDVSVNVLKAFEEGGELFVEGVVLRPGVTDRQGDVISASEIRKSAYRYMRESQLAGEMHTQILPSNDAVLVENLIVHKNMKRNGVQLKEGDWFVKFQVLSDTLKKKVNSGELNSFSIGGRGQEDGEEE